MKDLYSSHPIEEWVAITEELISNHPLDMDDIVDAVLESWESIFMTKIGGELQIGVDVFPSPQIMGNYLHELIPIKLSKKYPGTLRKEQVKEEKDIVYIPNNNYSIEIKTSSNANNIFGNRSYGQENSLNNSGKSKSGYYIGVNFEKFNPKIPGYQPKIKKIRFGWLDHSDWRAQAAATGQAAVITTDARDKKMKLIYSS